MQKFFAISAVLALIQAASANVYLHNPRGSNNRQSDEGKDVPNTARLFKSNNAAQGGYNADLGRGLYYLSGSIVPIEFTIAHGCGSPESDSKAPGPNSYHCDIVLQYMCSDQVRDGATSATIPEDKTTANMRSVMTSSFMYGMHENWEYYQHCKVRQRNAGLYVGWVGISAPVESAMYTRQSINRNAITERYGFECMEERDYYPYWKPSPWRDIAVITSTPSRCAYYKAQSANVLQKCFCEDATKEESCPQLNRTCLPAWGIPAPECLPAPFIRENLLSNDLSGYMMTYNWTIPNMNAASCVLRIRYNVSTDDYDTWQDAEWQGRPLQGNFLNSLSNANLSPIKPYPVMDCCGNVTGVNNYCKCGINFHPRFMPFATYQDRSHRFSILLRPESVKNKIHNLNGRGKRGNIVQTFPAVEYDFTPNVLHCRVGEWIHTQWSGSDNNRAQNGNNGEGLQQSDRHNMIQILSFKHNKPIDAQLQNLFSRENAMRLAFNDLYRNEKICKPFQNLPTDDNTRNQDTGNCAKLNPAMPYFDAGLQPCSVPGVFYYMSTRNNNFSNRSQKAVIVVHPCNNNETCSSDDTIPRDPTTGDFMILSSSASSLTASMMYAFAAVLAVLALLF